MESQETIAGTVRTLLEQLGEDPQREGLLDTPRRVAAAWAEMLRQDDFKITTFEARGYDQMVISRDIPYYTFCEHHMIPFFGRVTVGYLPDPEAGRIIGLSKLARVVAFYSHRLNTQEHFTSDIANFLRDRLEPKGVGVLVRGRHLCQEMRGARTKAEMVTSEMLGVFRDDPKARAEFLSLCGGQWTE